MPGPISLLTDRGTYGRTRIDKAIRRRHVAPRVWRIVAVNDQNRPVRQEGPCLFSASIRFRSVHTRKDPDALAGIINCGCRRTAVRRAKIGASASPEQYASIRQHARRRVSNRHRKFRRGCVGISRPFRWRPYLRPDIFDGVVYLYGPRIQRRRHRSRIIIFTAGHEHATVGQHGRRKVHGRPDAGLDCEASRARHVPLYRVGQHCGEI